MKVFITGGAGFIGIHLCKKLLLQNHDVTIYDNFENSSQEHFTSTFKDKVTIIPGDITHYSSLVSAMKNHDVVIHLSAQISVPASIKNPKLTFDVNVNGTENIFKLAKEYGMKVVFASSSSVYGSPKKIPIEESDDRKPLNPYGHTKLEDEYLTKKYSEMGVKIIGLRYFNVFGKRQSKEYAGVIKLFLKKIQQNTSPKINGDGLQTRDFVHIDDVVRANILAMDSDVQHGFFNVGTGNSISVLDLANVIINASGLSLKPIHGPELSGDVRTTEADITLIRKMLNWEPEINLENWLTRIISDKDFEDL